jgi:hypothetical protein
MNLYLKIGAALLLAAPSLAADKQASKVAAPHAPQPAAAAPKTPKAPQKLNDPGASVAQRLMQMTPEQRERALEKLPPERQAQIRQRLDRLDNLPPQQRQRMIQQYQQLASLPPEKQVQVRRQIQAFNQLPSDRKAEVGAELQKLRRMPESDRQARLAGEDFKNRFSPAEQRILADVSENMPLR